MKINVQKTVNIGLFAAMVAVFTFIKIDIPIGNSSTMIHLGNVFCVISGIILGPIHGGLAAGIGSFLFDVFNPHFFISAPFSLVFKFIMAFSCGIISTKKILKGNNGLRNDIIAIISSLLMYNILHIFKIFVFNRYLIAMPIETTLILVTKSGIVSLINSVITIVISIPLLSFLRKILTNVV